MKLIYSGNIDSLSSLFARINNEKSFIFFPSNKIIKAKVKNSEFILQSMFCKGIGQFKSRQGSLEIDLKIRLKRQFIFLGIFIIIFLTSFIWSQNVTINGDSNPSIWHRIGFAVVGLACFSIPTLILLRLRNRFEIKVKNLLE